MKENNFKSIYIINNNNIIEDKLELTLNTIRKDIHNFISKSNKRGYKFNIKINDKKKKIKIFVTLENNSDTNNRNEDIDFLIEVNEGFPEEPPFVFCLSCVKLFFN